MPDVLSHESCPHGQCLGHDPDWEEMQEKVFIPRPSFLLRRKRSLFDSCCGKRMLRVRIELKVRCRKCGEMGTKVKNWEDAEAVYCECCKRYYSTASIGMYYPVEY